MKFQWQCTNAADLQTKEHKVEKGKKRRIEYIDADCGRQMFCRKSFYIAAVSLNASSTINVQIFNFHLGSQKGDYHSKVEQNGLGMCFQVLATET